MVISLAVPAAILVLALRDNSPTVDAASGSLFTPKRARIGSTAPDFTLPAIDGGTVTLSALRGRAVVLTFLASWCNPCERDMPALEKAQHDNGDRVVVVGVNYQDFPDDTRAFVRRLGVTFPVLVEDASDNPVARRYDVHAMPDTVFIDRAGVVRARLFGEMRTTDLDAALHSLLRG